MSGKYRISPEQILGLNKRIRFSQAFRQLVEIYCETRNLQYAMIKSGRTTSVSATLRALDSEKFGDALNAAVIDVYASTLYRVCKGDLPPQCYASAMALIRLHGLEKEARMRGHTDKERTETMGVQPIGQDW